MKKYIVIALLMVLGTAYPAYARWSVGAAGGGAAGAACTDTMIIGSATDEASEGSGANENRAYCSVYQATASETITHLYAKPTYLSTGGAIRLYIYDTTGCPDTCNITSYLNGTAAISGTAGTAAYEGAVVGDAMEAGVSITSGNYYALCMIATEGYDYRVDANDAYDIYIDYHNGYVTPVDPLSEDASIANKGIYIWGKCVP